MSISSRSFTFAKVADQLGHLFWMGILAIAAGIVGNCAALVLWVMGNELMIFQMHVERERPVDGWMRSHWWWWLGTVMTIVGGIRYADSSDLGIAVMVVGIALLLIGSMAVSSGIHSLVEGLHPRAAVIAIIVCCSAMTLVGAYILRSS